MFLLFGVHPSQTQEVSLQFEPLSYSRSPSGHPGPWMPPPDPTVHPADLWKHPSLSRKLSSTFKRTFANVSQHFEISAVERISGSLSTTFLKPGTHSRVPGMTQLSSPSAAFSLKMHPKVGLTCLNANGGRCRSTFACAVGKPCRAAGWRVGVGRTLQGAQVWGLGLPGTAEHRPRHRH